MAKHIFHASDYPDRVALWRVDPRADPHDPDTEIYAPCCGRKVIACAVADVRGVQGTVVSGGGVRSPVDHGWLCDGCRHRLFINADNPWTESSLLEARGAPIQMVHWHRAEEWRTEMTLQASRLGESYNPQEQHELALDQITAIHRRDSEIAAPLEIA